MSHEYQRPVASAGLRLHLNEHTGGCSPKVLDAIRALTREQLAIYPEYDDAIEACAARLGVAPDNVLLTNGLDEGILVAAVVALRGAPAEDPYEAIIVQPAFDMYAACADGAGGRIVDILPNQDFSFPVNRLLAALTPRTRIIYVTSPNNPTGLSVSPADVATVAAAAPQAMVFLDEAYADFGGGSMVSAAASWLPNLVIGRTFAKAYGLAGIRAGALVATPGTLAPMRRIVPPYTLNACATAALPVALRDEAYYEAYLAEVAQSKALAYEVLGRFGVPFWPSDGNFVLARFGESLGDVIGGLAARGVIVRDRSKDPGCQGCARMTTGVVAHTRRLILALEEVLCAARS